MKKKTFLLVLLAFAFGACGGGGGGGGDATNGSTPVTNVSSATSISTNVATLNGNVNPNGLATNAWFEWGTDSALSTPTSTPPQSIGSGLSIVPVSLQITGLMENIKYYFRVCGSNSKGESESVITSFTTSSPGGAPAVTTLAATSVGATTATLNSNVTANGLATNAWFEWGTDSTLTISTSTSSQSIGSGTTSVPVTAGLTGLAAGTTYYYRVAASNGSGTNRGSILSFTPGGVPAVTTLAATSVGTNTATLNGNATANGLATNAWFEWGTDPALASPNSTSTQAVGSGTTSVPVNTALTGLTTGTTYYYRVAASNGSGTTRGSIASFTPGAAPVVTTGAPMVVGPTTATLTGSVAPNGLTTNSWFEWGTDSALTTFSSTSPMIISSSESVFPRFEGLTGLSSGTTYYYRNAASNSLGTTKGEILSFKTTNEISGIINTNTTLSISSSPYYFNNVQLDYGATLTIEPGVVISGGTIQVWGILNAIGNISSKIVFNAVSIKPGTSNSGKPFSINIQFAEVNNGNYYSPTGNAIYGNFTIRDSVINNIGWMYIWYPTSDCYIERNIINGSRIEILTNNGNQTYIKNNVFYNTSITNIANYTPSGDIVLYNSFLNGVTLGLRTGISASNMSATENYWNTTDTSVVDSMIYDRNDDLSYAGYILYQPILSSPHPNTPIP